MKSVSMAHLSQEWLIHYLLPWKIQLSKVFVFCLTSQFILFIRGTLSFFPSA